MFGGGSTCHKRAPIELLKASCDMVAMMGNRGLVVDEAEDLVLDLANFLRREHAPSSLRSLELLHRRVLDLIWRKTWIALEDVANRGHDRLLKDTASRAWLVLLTRH